MVNNKFGFAVIGYGGMGNWHARKIRNEMGEYAELIGIYDINPERCKVAEENGISVNRPVDENVVRIAYTSLPNPFELGGDKIFCSFGKIFEVNSVRPAEFTKHNTVAFFDYNPVNIPEDFIHFIFFTQCESVFTVEEFASVRRSVVAMY